MSNNFVLYIAPFNFPNGGAAARRIYGNCMSIKAAGYRVAVASAQVGEYKTIYNDIDVYSYNERKYESLPRHLKHFFYLNAGAKAIDFLEGLDEKPSTIILYSGYSPYLFKLRAWCTKNNVKLIFDVVEWYDAPNFLAKFTPYYLNIELAMQYLLPKCDGLIVISRYLENYYKSRKLALALVPPTLDTAAISPRLETFNSDCVKVCYAGSVGIKKDFLGDIIRAIYQVNETGNKLELHIAGLSFADLEKKGYLDGLNLSEIKNMIFAYGILSHENAIELVRNSDYSIVFRPNYRNVQAGFPTKFVESMSVGTPVIGNHFSDLENYLEDGFNGIVCQDYSIESLKKALFRCLSVDSVDELRRNARDTAVKYFDSKVHSEKISKILG